ncbi:hypothetical protein [Loktanella sp. R86503]|uniref:hypothetical protein n=1 Tax=Loktanella sp. R86503 TaxID=3093847 RepID=UPI0036DD7676
MNSPDLDWIDRRLAGVTGLERIVRACLLAIAGTAAIGAAIWLGATAAMVMA